MATAATQIEGGDLDTNWHRWAASGGVHDGSSPSRAADHWNRTDEDLALLVELGVRHYRMGVEWARIEPSEGVYDSEAIAHYRAELAALHDAGITPLVTLHHFDLPGWVVDRGGWLAPDAVEVFLRLVRLLVTELGAHVTDWVTINEPTVEALQGHYLGDWPPGERSLWRYLAVQQVLCEAHVRAYGLIHELQPSARVGVAHHLRVFAPADPRNLWHRLAARLTRRLFQELAVEATTTGRFAFPLRQPHGIAHGTYADFLGLNYYTRSTVRGLADGVARGVPVNDLGWEIHPDGLVELARGLHESYGLPIWVTENGTADAADAFRPLFLYEHLQRIAASGLPIERYYHWCFTDNWEWAEGEGPRFGLVALDYATQERSVRASGRFFADIIAQGGVTEQAYERWVAGRAYPRNV